MTLKNHTTTTALALATLFTVVGGCTPLGPNSALQAQTTRSAEVVQWEGSMAAGTTLEVHGFNGAIRAVAASGSQARMEATRRARRSDPSEVDIQVVEHAGGVTICAIHRDAGGRSDCRPGGSRGQSIRNNDTQVAFTLEVPAGVNLTARTSNGGITTTGMTAAVDARTSNGPIRVDGARTGTLRTSNGPVTVRAMEEATVSTSNGSITAELGRLEGQGPLRFTTSNGSVTLTLPAGANASVDARTSNGRIQSELPVTVSGTVQRNRLQGRIGAGGREIEVRTSNGSIRLRQGA